MSGSAFAVADEKHAATVQRWVGEFRPPALDASSVLGAPCELGRIVDALRAMTSPQRLAVPFPRVRGVQSGVFLHGKPGCGKTHLAVAAAGELGLPIFVAQPAHFIGVYWGETGRNLAALFEAGMEVARRGKGAVLFLDELEAYGQRSANPDAMPYTTLISNVLKLMDQAAAEPEGHRLAIVAASNEPRACDPALLSRLSTHLEIAAPDAAARRAYLERSFAEARAAGYRVEKGVVERLVAATDGFSARELGQLLDEVNARCALATPPPRQLAAAWFEEAVRARRAPAAAADPRDGAERAYA